jgi:murein DD-endopeptidase MepM/ murein hydrolase activator NlpD
MKLKIIIPLLFILFLGFVFRMPSTGKFTSPWGIRFLAGNWFHPGSDLGAPVGTPVHPVAAGTVVLTASNERWGNYIKLEHFPGVTSQYLHLSAITVPEGEKVDHATVIGLSGNTGTATTGPHLHFEIRLFNVPLPAFLICLPGKLLGGFFDTVTGARKKAGKAAAKQGDALDLEGALEKAGDAAKKLGDSAGETVKKAGDAVRERAAAQ